MEEKRTAARPSALPRLSRLPVPRSSSLRAAPSREGLNASTTGGGLNGPAAGGQLRNPRLRPAPSRDTLRSPVGGGGLKRSDTWDAPSRSQPQQPASATARAQQSDNPSRLSAAASDEALKRASEPIIPCAQAQKDEILFRRPLVLTRRPSEVFSQSPAHTHSSSTSTSGSTSTPQHASFDDSAPTSATADEGFGFDAQRRPLRTRPSLSERTMETLAQLPSSPALSRKTSTFFDPQSASKARARAGSGGSRPGTGYRSDGSNRPPSGPTSRPGSSSGAEEGAGSSLRASTNIYKPPLTSIDGTPSKRTIRSVKNDPVRTPSGRIASASVLPSPAGSVASAARSPSPQKLGNEFQTIKATPRTVGSRPLKPRPSVNGLFKKPSVQRLAASGAATDAGASTAAPTSSSAWAGIITPAPAPKQPEADDADSVSARKSSAALREQIARAKAAKRAALREASAAREAMAAKQAEEQEEEYSTPAAAPIPVPAPAAMSRIDSSTFETSPVAASADPFNHNQWRSENAKSKILQQRVAAGRTSGRLNIAAMGLKTIPPEVLRMYDAESIGRFDGSWAESVDLTRLVAADNEIETIDECIFPDQAVEDFGEEDESRGNIFGGLETLDLHGNLLIAVPPGLRRLSMLTSLNLSQNRLSNNSLDSISQITSLRDLKLANNLLYGPLGSCFSNLRDLEILDLHGNNVSSLPPGIEKLSRLRILNISENSFESLPFAALAKLPLTELVVRRNKIRGTLIDDADASSVESLPNLQSLDVSCNQIVRLVSPGRVLRLPSLHQLAASMNRLQALPDVSSWTSLLTLTVDENSISAVPDGFTCLSKLRHADFSSNDVRVVPPEIARMDSLAMIRLTGNPLRDKKFASITTEELKEILAGRLEPPPPYQERTAAALQPVEPKVIEVTAAPPVGLGLGLGLGLGSASPVAIHDADAEDDSRSDMDDFATPPTSAPASPARSRSQTLASQQWPVKPGGVLDRSHTQSSSLHPVICSRIAAEAKVREMQLHHNVFASLPNSLTFFASTLTALSMAHNQLVGEAYFTEALELPALRELNLSSNHITSLVPLTANLIAPALEKVDVSFNRIAALPANLRADFPRLGVLLVSNNHLVDLDPEAIRGLQVVDAGNNDIAHLNPRIGLLGGSGGLARLDVSGNRFRVPRWSVLERGTEATLRWLRGRVPIAEMSSWKEGNSSDGSSPDTSLADVD